MTRIRPFFRPRLECLEDRTTPATFNVTTTLDVINLTDGKRSLREAIEQANDLAGTDVIVLPAGVYKIALAGANENVNLTGDFDVTGAVTIQGAGAGATIIDGQQFDRVFDVNGTSPSSIKVVLEKMTIRNGDVTGHGGSVLFGNADLVVRDSVVTGNRASQTGGGVSNGASAGTGDVRVVRTTVVRNVAGLEGGGLFVVGTSSLTVTDGTIRRNLASASGGGIRAITATLTNSTFSGNVAGNFGGGISANTVTLSNSTVSGNYAPSSGGIFATTATLTNSTVSGNVAGNFGGGGIFATTANLTNSTVSGNSASGDGGGIVAITANLTNCTVSGNSAGGDGGGIFATTANLTNSTVSGNSAGGDGGGIVASGTATVSNSTVSGNTAGDSGGGIQAISTATLTNTTISGNTSSGNGGGMWANAASLLNCTIVENIAQTGGGLMSSPGGTISVRNTIVAQNLVGFGGTGPEVLGNFASGGHNLIGAGGSGFTNGVNGDIVGTNANPIDPKIGPLQNNGGKTKTHALLAGSPAIDKGDNAGVPATDQRGAGFPRKKDGDGNGSAVVDIGAFEK